MCSSTGDWILAAGGGVIAFNVLVVVVVVLNARLRDGYWPWQDPPFYRRR